MSDHVRPETEFTSSIEFGDDALRPLLVDPATPVAVARRDGRPRFAFARAGLVVVTLSLLSTTPWVAAAEGPPPPSSPGASDPACVAEVAGTAEPLPPPPTADPADAGDTCTVQADPVPPATAEPSGAPPAAEPAASPPAAPGAQPATATVPATPDPASSPAAPAPAPAPGSPAAAAPATAPPADAAATLPGGSDQRLAAAAKAKAQVARVPAAGALRPPAAKQRIATPPRAVESDEPAPAPAATRGPARLLRPAAAADAERAPSQSYAVPFVTSHAVPYYVSDEPVIPRFLVGLYKQAGKRYDVPWAILAAINEIETDFGRNVAVSSAGARGWMQFMPATWRSYGVDADGDGAKDPDNPRDAIFAAARYLRASGARSDLARAIFAYNHAGWYVESVLQRATRISEWQGERSRTLEQVLNAGKRRLIRQVLADDRITLYDCGHQDIALGRIDRRVLVVLRFLAWSGLHPTVTSLECGHSRLTTGGNVSAHSYGSAVDIAAINGIPILGHQGPGSVTEATIRELLTLRGAMTPAQIISLMTFRGASNTLAMSDHADHIHVGFRRLPGLLR